MVRGKCSQGNEKIRNLSSSDSRELENDDDITLPRGGPKKTYGLSSSKPDDEQKTFPTLQFVQSADEQQQLQPKRGRGRPRKIPIATTITNNDIDQNSSISNSESSSSKIILNQELNDLDDNINNSNDDQHNIISVIEIVDESQDNSITNIIKTINIQSENIKKDNLDYSNESRKNVEQHINDENCNQLQNDTNSRIIDEVITKRTLINFSNDDDEDDDLQSEIEIIKKEPQNFDIEAKINTESIITISSDESNFKTELKSRDTPISELIGRGSGGIGDVVSSPDILQVYIDPNSARTYQNKRKSKNDDININLENLTENNSKLDTNISDLNEFNQNKIVDVEDTLQMYNDNIINSIECRRSSRKKTMKYDVRDLLNKNRKKIQIEARIDSLPKKSYENSTATISNEIKLIPDNICKMSPSTGFPKINEFREIAPRKLEPPQLSPILLNDNKFSPPHLNTGTNFTKNLIQIQSRKSFENGTNQLPPPPPLKSIAELDRKNLTIPNGLYPNELNKYNKIYSFHDAFNSGIIKSGDNEYANQQTNSIEMTQKIKNTSSIQSDPTTTTIPSPVLSSMVKSPLLNIKFKHQNLAIRKSFDSLIIANSSTIALNDSDKNIFKDIKSQFKVNEQTKDNALVLKQIEKPIKVKGKRGRPPKNKLLSPKILNTSSIIQEDNKDICETLQKSAEKCTTNTHLLQNPITQKTQVMQSPENLIKLSIDNKFKDGKTLNVIEKSNINKEKKEIIESNPNKEDKIIEKCNHIIQELDVNTADMPEETAMNVQIQNKFENLVVDVQKQCTPNVIRPIQPFETIVNTEKLSNTQETELQRKKNQNKVQEEKLSKSSPAKQKHHSEFGEVEFEKSPQNLSQIFKSYCSEKKKPKDILNKESTKHSSYSEPLDQSQCKKNLEDKYGKSLLNKTKEKCDENERKIILPQNKLFLEIEKVHELKLEKLERKKSIQNKERDYTEKDVKQFKKISVEEKSDQLKNIVERKEIERVPNAIIKMLDKSQEHIKISEDLRKSAKEIIENQIFSKKSFSAESDEKTSISETIIHTNEEKPILDKHEKDEPYTDFKLQKDNEIFEQLAEKLIDNEINSLNLNANTSNQNDQNNEPSLSKYEEKLTTTLNDYSNKEKNIKIIEEQNEKSITPKINQLSPNTLQDEKNDSLISKDKCLIVESDNIQLNEILVPTKNNSADKERIKQKDEIISEEDKKNVLISKGYTEAKLLIVSSTTETLSVSPSTDSNDPLKDIEKFLEAAGNLLSRSFSSEDEKDPSSRRARSGSRFKDCGNKEDDDWTENNDNLSEVDGVLVKLDEESSKVPTSLQNACNRPQSTIKEVEQNLDKDISKMNQEESKEVRMDLTKIENLEKALFPVLKTNQISVNPDYQNIPKNIQSENNESILCNNLTEFPTCTKESLNFSHKFLTQETLNLLQNSSQAIEIRTPGPRTPPFPPPNDLPIEEEISFLQNSLKSEKSILNNENNSNPITASQESHSDSMTSNSNSSKSAEPKSTKSKSSKKIENDLKLIKKLKRKDEKKIKKKDGITDELKRTIKEMKKIKKSTSDEHFLQGGTLSKAAMKSYSPVNSIDNSKTDGDSRSLDDLLELDDNQIIYDQNNKNIRRSHRLKTITKSQSVVVGRGLVRDRERYDKEYDDIKPDLAVIEAQNAKFLKDMEERLSQFQVIRDNEYKCERVISKEAKKMNCDCFLTREEEERGEFGCGEDCLNRLLMIECGPKCTVGDRCTNRRFQRAHYAPCKVFQTEKKGCGIMADAEIPCGQFIMEYVGEVLNSNQFEKRAEMYSQDKNKHYYFMALRSDAIIDATTRGNISRFINHSCDPNAETQKWTVNGELRIGFFTTRTILSGEEVTFDYQFQRYGKEAQRCYCETSNCRGWIGEEPDDSDEEELEDESEDDDKIKTENKKEISHKIIKEIPQNLFKPKSVQEISQKTDTDIDKENIEIIKTKPDKKEKKKRGRKKRLDFRLGNKSYEFLDDPDLEDEVLRLLESGLKNQVQTLCLSRLFVRAKQLETRLNLLQILSKGEMSCRRLFLDYHGLKLLHGWMSETTELVKDTENDLKIRLNLLETLECLPIPNKTMLKDSKVFQTVQNWSHDKTSTESSPNEGSPNDNSNSGLTTPINVAITMKSSTDFVNIDSEKPILLNTNENLTVENPIKAEIKTISTKLITIWDGLPEVFRIPRKERVEQMKEHEREADKQYAALKLVDDENEIRRNRGRFIKDIKENSIISNNTDLTPGSGGSIGKYKWSRDLKSEIIKERRKEFEKFSHQDGLSKLQRRQMFAAKVAQHEAEKRLADEKRESEIKCKFYGLDPLTTHPRDFPFCVNPATGQWYTIDRRKIPTPPSHAHIKVPPKPQSTMPEDYHLPSLDLPPFWKFAIDPHRGRIYYYHIKIRIPQWEPPIKILPLNDGSTVTSDGSSVPIKSMLRSSKDLQNEENDSSDSGSESGDSLNDKNKDEITADGKLSEPLNPEQKKLERKKKRYGLLVQERPISPRREEDRVYNQIEMRRYKENKEKIRRRKEEIKRRKIQLARHLTDQQNIPDEETNNDNNEECIALDQSIESDAGVSATSNGVEPLPIADYLLSSDEEETITTFCDANLIEKIVKGEKIVDELDALNINRPLKRLLSFKEKNSTNTVNSVENKSKKPKTDEKKGKNDDEIKKPKSSSKLNNPKYLARKAKEKFRADIAGIIVSHLTPYRKDTCKIGKITKNEDFKHLARKLTHFVMVKELKHCDLTGQQLIVTDSVKNKSREFIKKYMAKYGEIYIRPENDPEFKEIPH